MTLIDVTVVLLEGGMPSTSMVPLEIFGCAGRLWSALHGKPEQPLFRVRTASIDGRETANEVPVVLRPSVALSDVTKTDLVVIPAAGMNLAEACARNQPMIRWLKEKRPKRTAVAGICSGVALVAAAGLLDGKTATTHWGVVEQSKALFPKVEWDIARFVTEAENVFCGGGLYASIDLSLYLVEHYCGHLVAVQTAKALLLETPRLWQTAYASQPPRSEHLDEPVQKAQKWLVSHLSNEISMEALAEHVGMSPRNFARRFKAATGETPLTYMHRIRIDRAKRFLENEHRSVHEVSRDVGYEDVAFFRTLFRRFTGTSPREYRARFGPMRN